jgi:ubiquinone/menaquinone biosynthesis C-methylase UbiE
MTSASLHTAPPAPFDVLAATYDELFTHSLIGRAQRGRVWQHIDKLWRAGDRVLELNCGTGEDALHLAASGVNVTACDSSAAMISVARDRLMNEFPSAPVEFHTISNEHLGQFSIERPFDGVFSNFSGLNCTPDLGIVARQLASLVRPGAKFTLCLSTRFCAWEFFWYALRGQFRRSIRRWSGHTVARVGREQMHIWYPTVHEIDKALAPWFRREEVVGIGTAVPPSYAEAWARSHPNLFELLRTVDSRIHRLPVVRVLGDHMLLRFRRCSA